MKPPVLLSHRRPDPMRTCAHCKFAWVRSDNGNVGCGAGVDDAALQAGDNSKNPIWAVRKYGHASVLAMLRGETTSFPPGSEAENMKAEDGAECATYERRPTLGPAGAIDVRAAELEQQIPQVAKRWLRDGPPGNIEVTIEVTIERAFDRHPGLMGEMQSRTDGFLTSAALFLGPDFEWRIIPIVGDEFSIRAMRYIGDQSSDAHD